MELIELKNEICKTFSGTKQELKRILHDIENDVSIFPFNEYENLICKFIATKNLEYDKYLEIRTEYIDKNPNLWIYEISAPRGFGEKFAQTYVSGKCSKLEKPSKKLDPNYKGEYDLWLDGIKIEVKASRATDSNSKEPLYMKALSYGTKCSFSMNFQQLKPQCCDVFIWVAVFRDEIILWIINSEEVAKHKLFSGGQHRGNKGNEGQLHIKDSNIKQFDKYKLKGDNLKAAIKTAYKQK